MDMNILTCWAADANKHQTVTADSSYFGRKRSRWPAKQVNKQTNMNFENVHRNHHIGCKQKIFFIIMQYFMRMSSILSDRLTSMSNVPKSAAETH
jgi:hypothetical protein